MILSAEMMLRHMGWREAADLIIASMEAAIADKAGHLRLRAPDGRRDEVSCSGFGQAMIERM